MCIFHTVLPYHADFLIIADDNNFEGRKLMGVHLNRNQSLFYVELPSGTILSHVVEENENFPFQFGREVRTCN